MNTQFGWELRILRGKKAADDVVEVTIGDYVVYVQPSTAKRMGAQLMQAGSSAENMAERKRNMKVGQKT